MDLHAGIVRILKPNRSTAGTGFLVAENLIATCAHVVTAVGATAGERVTLVFHATGEEGRAYVEPEWWREANAEDVAILRLEQPIPEGVEPLILGPSGGASEHDFASFGFSQVGPYEEFPASGTILGSVQHPGGWETLIVRSQDISPGMSGAPVLDKMAQRVVGMVNSFPAWTDKERRDKRQIAGNIFGRYQDINFAASSETLEAICPELELSVSRRVLRKRVGIAAGVIAALVVLIVAAAIGSGLGATWLGEEDTPVPPSPTPSVAGNDVGVIVAKFALSDDIDSQEADLLVERFSNLLEQELTDSLSDARLTVGFLRSDRVARVSGANASERDDNAQRLASDYGADIVVYGLMKRHEVTDQVEIQPEFYVTPESFTDALEMTGSFRFGSRILVNEPLRNALEAEVVLSSRTIALAHVMAGLSQYMRGDFVAAQTAIKRAWDVPAWEEAEGLEVVHVLLGNTYVRLAAEAASQCERREVLVQLEHAVREYESARGLAPDYSRAYAGLASATHLSALWTPEENDGCNQQSVDLGQLEEVLALVTQAQRMPDQPKEVSVGTKVQFVQAQALFGLWNTESVFTESEYVQLYQDFWDTSERIIRNYEEGDYPAVAPIVVETYGLRGLALQTWGECRAAIEQYDLGLRIDTIDPSRQMTLVGWKGDCYRQLGQLTLAAEAYTEALRIAQVISDEVAGEYYASLQKQVDNQLQGRPTATVTWGAKATETPTSPTPETTATPLPPPPDVTATPVTPTPEAAASGVRVVSVREGAPSNALRGVSFGLGGAIGASSSEKCNQASPGIWGVIATGRNEIAEYESGAVVKAAFEHPFHVGSAPGMAVDNAFAFPEKPYVWVWEGFVAPRICASTPVQAVAISPDGDRHPASIIRYELPDSEESELNEKYVVRLPLEAYAQPGLWHLVVEAPSDFELGVEVPTPDRPLYLREGEQFLLMGFERHERLVGVVFVVERFAFKGDFYLEANERGSAFIELDDVNGPVFFVGETGNAIMGVSANWWPGSPRCGFRLSDTLYDAYWGDLGLHDTYAISATVAVTANVYAEPDTSSDIVSQLSVGQQMTLIGRDWQGQWVQLNAGENHWVDPCKLNFGKGVAGLPVTAGAPDEMLDYKPRGTLGFGDVVGSVIDYDEAFLAGDAWTFTGDEDTVVALRAKNNDLTSVGMDFLVFVPQLELFGPGGAFLARGDPMWERRSGELKDFRLPTSGTYTVVVRGFGPTALPTTYDLSLSAITTGDGDVAGRLLYGDIMDSELVEGTSEWWTFFGTARDVVSVAVDGEADLALYSPAGTLEASGEKISGYELSSMGAYAIRVTGREAGAYTISLDLEGIRRDSHVLSRGEVVESGNRVEGEGEFGFIASPRDSWAVLGQRSELITITLETEQRARLWVEELEGELLIGSYAKGSEGQISYSCLLPAKGRYVVVVSAGGSYTLGLESEQTEACLAGCAVLRYGERVVSELPSSGGATVSREVWRFEGRVGDQVTVEMISDSFDAHMDLYGPDGRLLAHGHDPDSPSARIHAYRLPEGGRYVILAYGSPGESGPYDLELKASR